MLHKDAVAGLGLLALAGGYVLAVRRIPDSSLSDAVGPTGLPYVLAAALALLALALLAKGLVAGRAPAAAAPADDDKERSTPARAMGFVLIGVGYMILAPLVGYILGIAALLIAVALYERARPSPMLLAVAGGGAIAYWLIFVVLLGTQQPASPFWS